MKTSDLTFNPETHEYHRGLVKVPGVTDIMESAGLISEFCKDEVAAEFGRIFHSTIRLKIMNRLGVVSQKFIDEGWMESIEKFVSDQNPVPFVSHERGLERILFSKRYGYAGTLDFYGRIAFFKNSLCLLDWKTISEPSKVSLKNCDMQTAAYENLIREYEEIRGKIVRAMVWFYPFGYEILWRTKDHMNSPAAWPAFQSALNLKRWKEI
jgi:hypothetical protein